jgi:hypothetical protein
MVLDEESHAPDRRGMEGAPPYGRRAIDRPLHEMADEVRQMHADFTQRLPTTLSPTRLVTIATGLSTIAAFVVGVLVWLGGDVVGPGARLNDYVAERRMLDSAASADRQAILRAVRAMTARMARQDYEFCIKVDRQAQGACFDAYIRSRDGFEPPLVAPSRQP